MKSTVRSVIIGLAVLTFFSCQNKKEETKEIYVNPAFRENLSEVYDVIAKRYILDYNDLLNRFGPPNSRIIDSVQSEANEAVFDSTFVLAYNKIAFRYYKRSIDKKILFMGVDLTGDFKTRSFVLKKGTEVDEVLNLFGEPSRTDEKEYSVEFSYPLYKDEEGKSYDTIIFIFVEDKLAGINYVPFIDIYPEAEVEEQY